MYSARQLKNTTAAEYIVEYAHSIGCLCTPLDIVGRMIARGTMALYRFVRFQWTLLNLTLFSDAERAEDEVKDVVGRGRPGNCV